LSVWSLHVLPVALFTVCGFISTFLNSLTDLFLTPPQRAAQSDLEHTDLQTLTGEPRSFKAKVLWDRSGAVIMAVRRPG
uniref:Uncharacterized protein n=1 Tax=Gouania willdenowi TaxID=441366 RepID=A0A8C5GH22_GOUWI